LKKDLLELYFSPGMMFSIKKEVSSEQQFFFYSFFLLLIAIFCHSDYRFLFLTNGNFMSEKNRPVRVRFAPSPTGYLHVGGARTAIYNYFFAKAMGGTFYLRIEDTDRKRYNEDALKDLLRDLKWLGLQWDEGPGCEGDCGPYFQSERLDIYAREIKKLLDSGDAYTVSAPRNVAGSACRLRKKSGVAVTGYDRHCRDIPRAEEKHASLRAKRRSSDSRSLSMESPVLMTKSADKLNTRMHCSMILYSSNAISIRLIISQVWWTIILWDHSCACGDEWISSIPSMFCFTKPLAGNPRCSVICL
jgi:glutamyl-tRNA synthetase